MRVNAAVLPEQVPRGDGVLNGLLFHGERREILRSGNLLAIDVGALIIAQHGDAALGQHLGQVAEGLHRAHGFIPVIGAGAMHQHHRRHRALGVFRQGQRTGKLPGRFANHDALPCLGGFLRRGGSRGEVHPGNQPIPVQHHGAGQVDTGHQHGLRVNPVALLLGNSHVVRQAEEFPACGFKLCP